MKQGTEKIQHIKVLDEYLMQIASKKGLQVGFEQLSKILYWCPVQTLWLSINLITKLIYRLFRELNRKRCQNQLAKARQLERVIEQRLHQQQQLSILIKLQYIRNKIRNYIQNQNYKYVRPQKPNFNSIFSEFVFQQNYLQKDNKSKMKAQELQLRLLSIAKGQTMPNSLNCIDCIQLSQNHQFPETGQFKIIVGFNDGILLNTDVLMAICSILNAGGGYLFINYDDLNIVKGIQLNFQQRQQLYQNIYAFTKLLKPTQNFTIQYIDFIVVGDSIQHSSKKYIVKIYLRSQKNSVFYVQNSQKAGKIIRSFYIYHNQEFMEISGEKIYQFCLQSYKYIDFQEPMACNIHKLSSSPIRNKISIISKKIGLDRKSFFEQPVETYKNSTIILIRSKKIVQHLRKTMQKQLKQKKINYTITQPYSKYCGKTTWFISHNCDFKVIKNIIGSTSHNLKSKVILVIPKNYICLKKNGIESKLQILQKTFYSVFDTQLQMRQNYSENDWKTQGQQIYFRFQNKKQATFTFVFLDKLNIRCQFVSNWN